MAPGHDHDHHGHGHAHDHGHDHGHAHAHDHGVEPPLAPEELSDPAQQSLVRALQSSFNVLRIIMVALLVAYAFSGAFRVQPGEQGLIVRFGALRQNTSGAAEFKDTPIFEPGWHVALPDPFDEKILIPGNQQQLTVETFLFERRQEDRGKPLSESLQVSPTLRPGIDGALLTGDKNLSHGRFTVQYRIVDGARFVRNVSDSPGAFARLLQRLTENAVVQVAATRRVEDVIGSNVSISADVRSRLQAQLAVLESGVEIDAVVAETIEPLQVVEAFREVTAAEQRRQAAIETAEGGATQMLTKTAGPRYRELLDLIQRYGAAQVRAAPPEELHALETQIDAALSQAGDAGGDVAGLLRTAQSNASEAREKIRREVSDFTQQLALYRKEPRVALWRAWVDMREAVLGSKSNELIYVPNSDLIQITTNRDPMKRQQRMEEAYRSRATGQPPRN